MTEAVSRCQKCNRRLTDPNSIRHGYGPVCFVKVYGYEMSRPVRVLLEVEDLTDATEWFK